MGTANLTPVVAAVAAAAMLLYHYVIYPTFICPMAKIPVAHWSARYSTIWLHWIRWTDQENNTVLRMHRKSGPILRLAPNELSLNSFEGGLKPIYLGNFPRSEFYPKGFFNYGKGHMFTFNVADHAARKRLFSNIFSKSHLLTNPAARANTQTMLQQRLLPLVDASAKKNNPILFPEMNFSYSMDSFVNWQFGMANGSNLLGNQKERRSYLEGFFGREIYGFLAIEMDGLVSFLQRLGIRLIPSWVDKGTEDIENWNIDMCDKADAVLKASNEIDVVDTPSVYAQAMKTMGKEKPETLEAQRSQRLEIASEMFSFNSAAHETSGVTLTYVYYELSRRPELQTKLREELMTLDPPVTYPVPEGSTMELPSSKDLDSLSLLDAVVLESLRLYPAVAGRQPRVTPKQCSLGGFDEIPAGVKVQCYAYCLHRNPEVFPDPEEWKPERWINAPPTELSNMRRWFWAFGSGSSMCIGSNFALLSMKWAVAGIYTNYTTTIHEHDDMEQGDAYIAGPKGDKLRLSYHHV